jgi:hypothetical protein
MNKQSNDQRKIRLAQIEGILFDYGLQSTLKSFIVALENLMKVRGKSIEALCVLECMKGALAGYLRRYEPEYEEEQKKLLKV